MNHNCIKLTLLATLLAGCTTVGSQVLTQTTLLWPADSSPQIVPAVSSSAITTFDAYINYLKQHQPEQPLVQVFDGTRDKAHFPLFIDYLTLRAQQQGISESVIASAFESVYFIERAVKADKNQLEKKITLNDYLQRVLSQYRYQQAKKLAKQHANILSQVENQSGVPARFIMSLWGLESAFGRIQGKEDVISAVATLAYEGRREAFFTKEVMAALTVLEKGYIARDKMKGSWAGAMGQCQFMPSSLLGYGKDGDQDGQIDIWSNQKDVFASIANYLSTIGWDNNVTWGHKIQLPKSWSHQLAGLEVNKAKTVAQWQQLGVKWGALQTKLPAKSEKAWVILADDNPDSAYLVYNNFKTLMHWNRSYYFGISVGMLADSLLPENQAK